MTEIQTPELYPMDLAPKDGSWIIIAHREDDRSFCDFAHWSNDAEGWFLEFGMQLECCLGWMPLPNIPEQPL